MTFSPKVIAAVAEAMLSNKNVIDNLDNALKARKVEALRDEALTLLRKELIARHKNDKAELAMLKSTGLSDAQARLFNTGPRGERAIKARQYI